MSTLIFIFIFLLGTIIGSFLNVVIYRFNTGRTIVKGRSMCMSCGHSLSWYELIPVFSFLIQSGKCRTCANKISHQYPIVEILTGILFTLIANYFLPILYISVPYYVFLVTFFVFIFSLLMIISVYDIKHKVIPNKLVYAFIFISLISVFVNQTGMGSLFITPSYLDLIAGPVFALPFALLWLFSKGRLIGLGDAKLILGIGWMLGMMKGLAAITLSFWLGSIVSLLIIILSRNKKINMHTEIPFAPFLIIGTLVTFLLGLDIISLASLFQL